jgi:hypothetical protein
MSTFSLGQNQVKSKLYGGQGCCLAATGIARPGGRFVLLVLLYKISAEEQQFR